MCCAICGRLGPERKAWKRVKPLPFELAVFPHRFFAALRLPVVSYALPALIAIGYARYFNAPPSRISFLCWIRRFAWPKVSQVLESIQPSTGGFLEATPLTGFVTMALANAGETDHPVVENGVRFILDSMKPDGSWPIDTNLATWTTTLSVKALLGQRRAPGFFPARSQADPRLAAWPTISRDASIHQRRARWLGVDGSARRRARRGRYSGSVARATPARSKTNRSRRTRRNLVARPPERRRRNSHVLPRMGRATLRSIQSRSDRPHSARLARLAEPNAVSASSANRHRDGQRGEFSTPPPESRRSLDTTLVWQSTHRRREQPSLRNRDGTPGVGIVGRAPPIRRSPFA